MVPGIDPKIDYAFKRVFGLERNRTVLLPQGWHGILLPDQEVPGNMWGTCRKFCHSRAITVGADVLQYQERMPTSLRHTL